MKKVFTLQSKNFASRNFCGKSIAKVGPRLFKHGVIRNPVYSNYFAQSVRINGSFHFKSYHVLFILQVGRL